MEDVEITTCRSGDHFSCIVRHIPTGMCAECNEFIGIYRNQKKALAILKETLLNRNRDMENETKNMKGVL